MVRRDSAGIVIVEHAAVDSARVAWWRLEETPALSIGSTNGDAEGLFRVSDAARLSDGRIAIASRGSKDVRFFGPDGSHVRTSGRQGAGPGEFVYPHDLVVMPGDSLLVLDPAQARLTVLDPAGEYVRDGTAHGIDSIVTYDGGAIIARLRSAEAVGVRAGTIFRRQHAYAVLRDGSGPDTLGTFPGAEEVHVTGTLARRPFDFPMDPLWGRLTLVAFHDGQLLVVTSEAPEYRSYDRTGRLVRIVRVAARLEPVTPEMVARIREGHGADAAAAVEEDLKNYVEAYARRPARETVPPFLHMRVDAEGNVWLRDYDVGWTSDLWTVYSAEGDRLARIRIPWRFRVLEIGPDWILVLEQDDLDVEYVRLYRLWRGV